MEQKTDNAELHKITEELRESERLISRLKSKNEELQSIVYISSHDLRTPLINIEGFSGSLKRNCKKLYETLANESISNEIKKELSELLEETIPEDLLFITQGTSKMKMLIDGLLQVSRVGTVEIKMENLDMNEIIEHIIANVSYRANEIEASVTCQSDLPPCHADSNQINQLFSNLIDNAIKYLNPKRKGKIHISGHCENERNIYSIKDNGIGIDEKHQKRIFEVYHRLNPGDNVEGEGLGLTIIRRILDRHDGRIWLNSVPGEGSEFFVSLPISR
jgi:light-regulated signal transduction histidine kinase (bacteriophytochrome)